MVMKVDSMCGVQEGRRLRKVQKCKLYLLLVLVQIKNCVLFGTYWFIKIIRAQQVEND